MKVEGEKIKAEDAEFMERHIELMDPYGVFGSRLLEGCSCVGRSYFVRSKRRKIWVWEHDVPRATLSRAKELRTKNVENDIEF